MISPQTVSQLLLHSLSIHFTFSVASVLRTARLQIQKTLHRRTKKLLMRGLKKHIRALEGWPYHTPHCIPSSVGDCKVFEDRHHVWHIFMSLNCITLLSVVKSFCIRSWKASQGGCPIELSVMTKMFSAWSCMEATRHMWPQSTCNGAGEAEALNF